MTAQLKSEWLEIVRQGTTPEDESKLLRAGIPHDLVREGLLVGCAAVFFDGDRFQFHPDSDTRAIIVPVRQPPPPYGIESVRPELAVRRGYVVDLIAITKHRVALRLGASDVLGCVGPQILDPDPVQIWRHPLSWLRASGAGLCLATDDEDRQRDVLMQLRGLIAEDAQHGRYLEKILQRPYRGLPRVWVRDRSEAVA